MDCKKVSTLMSSYIDNQLSPNEKQSFEEHIADCDSCREELDFMQNILKDVNDLNDEKELPSDFHENLMVKIDNVKSSQKHTTKITKLNEFRKYYTAIAAVFVAVLIFGFIGISNLNKYAQDDYLKEEALPIEEQTRAMPKNIVTYDSTDDMNTSSFEQKNKTADVEDKVEMRMSLNESRSASQYTSKEKVSMKKNKADSVNTQEDESNNAQSSNKKQSSFKWVLIGILMSVLILVLVITVTKKFIINNKS